MPRTVLLRHTLADPPGGWHFDWLIARDGDDRGAGAGPLISFRVGAMVHRLGAGERFTADRIADHRAVYLSHEGEVGSGGGRVARVAEGTCRVVEEGPERVRIVADWGDGESAYVGSLAPRQRPGAPTAWEFVVLTHAVPFE